MQLNDRDKQLVDYALCHLASHLADDDQVLLDLRNKPPEGATEAEELATTYQDISRELHALAQRVQQDRNELAAIVSAANAKGMTGCQLMSACYEDPDRLNNSGVEEAAALLAEEDDVEWILGIIHNWK